MANDLYQSLLEEAIRNPLKSAEQGQAQAATAQIGNIQNILAGATATISNLNKTMVSTMATQKAITDSMASNNQNLAAVDAGTAQVAGEAAANKTRGALEVQQTNQANRDTLGLDMTNPTSRLRQLADDFTTAIDRSKAERETAQRQAGISIVDVFRGTQGIGDWLSAKFVDTPGKFEARAQAEDINASAAANGIMTLQKIYTNELPVTEASANILDQGSVTAAYLTAAHAYIKEAHDANDDTLKNNFAYLKEVLGNATSVAMEKIKFTNIQLQAEALMNREGIAAAKLTDENYARAVQMGAKMIGRADASTWTPATIKQMGNTPQNKALMDTLASAGFQIYGAAANGVVAPTGGVFGSGGETAMLLQTIPGAKLPQGSEPVQRQLMKIAGDASTSMGFDKLKPADRARVINSGLDAWLDSNKNDLAGTDIYGKPDLKTVASMASMQTPEVAAFTEKVLKPLAASGQPVPEQMVIDSAYSSGLSQPQLVAGITAYANSVAAWTDAVKKPMLGGFKAAQELPYTANLATGSKLFGRHKPVNLKDKKQVTDYLFRRGMHEGLQKQSWMAESIAAEPLVNMTSAPGNK